MIRFCETTLKECRSMFDAYLSTICGVNDDFWEEHVLGSRIYAISIDGRPVGLTGVYQGENLTFFYMPLSEQRYAQQAFEKCWKH